MTRIPTLYVSHGSPMLALDPGATGTAWHTLAERLPRPRAIVVVSAHWSAPTPVVGNGGQHQTIHDFYGFPAALYQLRYDAPGDPALAAQLARALEAAGWTAALDPQRGLDHGAWVPLRSMYPAADIPVVPVAINARRDPAYHYHLGEALRSALDHDVLLIASGSLTHNLHEFVPGRQALPPPAYVEDFQQWIFERLQAGDLPALLDYRRQAPAAERAHPTDEHLLPLFAALGAGSGAPGERLHASQTYGVLAMDAYAFA